MNLSLFPVAHVDGGSDPSQAPPPGGPGSRARWDSLGGPAGRVRLRSIHELSKCQLSSGRLIWENPV